MVAGKAQGSNLEESEDQDVLFKLYKAVNPETHMKFTVAGNLCLGR
jgi:hypothetical protein